MFCLFFISWKMCVLGELFLVLEPVMFSIICLTWVSCSIRESCSGVYEMYIDLSIVLWMAEMCFLLAV